MTSDTAAIQKALDYFTNNVMMSDLKDAAPVEKSDGKN